MNHSFKKSALFVTLYYQNIKNPVQRVNSVYNDTILNRVYTNAGRARLFRFEFGSNCKRKNCISLYLRGTINKYKINGVLNILSETTTVSNGNWVYSINGNSTFSLDKNWSITTNVNYTSAKLPAHGEDSSFLSPNLSAKTILFDGKGSIGLQWQYIDFGTMNSNQQRSTT